MKQLASLKFMDTSSQVQLVAEAVRQGLGADDIVALSGLPRAKIKALMPYRAPEPVLEPVELFTPKAPPVPVEPTVETASAEQGVDTPQKKPRRKSKSYREPAVPAAYRRDVPGGFEDMVEVAPHVYVNRRSATELHLIVRERDDDAGEAAVAA